MIAARRHGTAGPAVVVLHGGPAAAGSALGLALTLAPVARVLEPWQRGSGGQPLSVARHVADLGELLAAEGHQPVALVGHSWGAMLALAFAAAQPAAVGRLALVGCGTFDPAARAEYQQRCAQRQTAELQAELASAAALADPAARMLRQYAILGGIYDYDAAPDPADPAAPPFDAVAHEQTWADALECQADGRHPASFARLEFPVALFHGAWDPHPGRLIADGLRAVLPQLDYHEYACCGHRPWAERRAAASFGRDLRAFCTSPP
ncbi:MAG: alpha/beta hydrolase [Fimbriimonadaceae bacterium]|nr:alpha/beta hydrolase [Fimbriimonadaceae bacterium]